MCVYKETKLKKNYLCLRLTCGDAHEKRQIQKSKL